MKNKFLVILLFIFIVIILALVIYFISNRNKNTSNNESRKNIMQNSNKNIDYAFFYCDGIYNMGLDEAINVAKMVKAKHSIPYHMTGSTTNDFDRNKANNFDVPGKLILETGEKIVLEKDNNEMINQSEEEIVLNRYKQMLTAMCDKDEDVLNEVIKDGTTFTHMSGKTQTKEEYIYDIVTKRLDYKSYTIDNPEVTIEENKAILKAKVSLTANAYGAYGTYPFNVTAYFEKIDGNWYYRNSF